MDVIQKEVGTFTYLQTLDFKDLDHFPKLY